MSPENRCTLMVERIPADGKRGSQPVGVSYPTPAGVDAFSRLCRGRPDRRCDKPGLGQVWLSVCAVLSRTLTVRKVILGTGDLSGASLLFSGSVPLISYRPALWPLYAFGLKLSENRGLCDVKDSWLTSICPASGTMMEEEP